MRYMFHNFRQTPSYYLATLLIVTVCSMTWNVFAQDQNTRPFKEGIIRKHLESNPKISQTQLEQVGHSLAQWRESNDVLQRYPEIRKLKGLTVSQILAYSRLKERIPDLKMYWDEHQRVPIYISAGVLEYSHAYFLPAKNTFKHTARGFFQTFKDLLRINDPDNEFRVLSTYSAGENRTCVKYQQTFQGNDIWGKEIIIQFDAQGNIDLFTGRYLPSDVLNIIDNERISPEDALQIVINDLSIETDLREFSAIERQIIECEMPVVQKLVFHSGESEDLSVAYKVEIRPNMKDSWRYFVDIESGRILQKYNATCSDGPTKANAKDLLGVTRTIDTYLHQGTYYLIDASRTMYNAAASVIPTNPVGAIVTLDANNTDLKSTVNIASANNTWNDPASVSAHYNAAVTYEYFRTTHARNAIDNRGSSILSVVNVTENGQSMDNAYWNGKFIMYGNGAQYFKPLASGLDVSAHEMTHGVTEYSANLEYINQSGALNESFSDIFAVMVDRDDWKLGEDIVKPSPAFPTGAMRDMEDPHNGGTQGTPSWQPKHMSEYQNLPINIDNGGVHINGGIPNHAAYLLGTAIGRDKAEKIFYCALTTKLTKQSQFIDFRLAIARCAEEIHGQNSPEATACKNACDLVGITDGNPTTEPDDIPMVDGPDRMLFVSTDPMDPYFLWTVSPPANPSDFFALSTTPVFHRPSVSDDGAYAVFIDDDDNLRAIALNPTAPNEQIIDNSGWWSSVALSRDQKLVALTTIAAQPVIHVFNISTPTPTLKSFTLYTPNYSGENLPNIARFADAMDFSHDNQKILFDLYNSLDVGGYSVGFWDINTIDVWNAATASFGSGRIERVFPQQPDVSVGNPSFAKNKPTVFSFDLQLPLLQEGYVMATDFLKNQVKQIAQINYNEPGFPSYRGDDRMISFAATSILGFLTVYNVEIASNAITPTSSPVAYIPYAQYPVWYRTGSRPVSAEALASTIENFELYQNYPNPFNPGTAIRYRITEPGLVRIDIFDAVGREVKSLVSEWKEPGSYVIWWDGKDSLGSPLPSGSYFYRLTSGNRTAAKTMLLLR